MYVMMGTQSDFAFVVRMMSQFMSRPSLNHWMELKHIMNYLKDIFHLKLCLGPKNSTLRRFMIPIEHEMYMIIDSLHDISFLLAIELFCEIARNNLLLCLLKERQNTWLQVITLKRPLALTTLNICQISSTREPYHSKQAFTKNPPHNTYMKHIDIQHYFVQ